MSLVYIIVRSPFCVIYGGFLGMWLYRSDMGRQNDPKNPKLFEKSRALHIIWNYLRRILYFRIFNNGGNSVFGLKKTMLAGNSSAESKNGLYAAA
jgi:hypothetical protein